MRAGARRLMSRPLPRAVRRVRPVWHLLRASLVAGVCLLAGSVAGHATPPDVIMQAEYAEPTTRYAHGVLGDDAEWGAIALTIDTCQGCDSSIVTQVTIRLPKTRVFEDIAPRIFMDNEGATLVAVVESDLTLGARLAIYAPDGLYAATPFIGRAHRWLAPVAVADLDGDGYVEIAYVDRPHLAKTLRVFRLIGDGDAGVLQEVANATGVNNHQIGWDFIPGGLRDCGAGPEMVVASGDWRDVMAVRFDGAALRAVRLGAYGGPESLSAAVACQ